MAPYKLDYTEKPLRLNHPFTISRGSKEEVRNVFIRLEKDGITGYGEAAPNLRYGEHPESVMDILKRLDGSIPDYADHEKKMVAWIRQAAGGVHSAGAALEMAWLDWRGKREDRPLWKLLDAPSQVGPVTSYTIGIDNLDVIRQKMDEAEEYPVLKIKLGTKNDREIFSTVRELTDKPVRVDINEGWNALEEAKAGIDLLANQNVELIEQPMPADHLDDMKKLKAYSPIPLCADESFTGKESLVQIAESFDCINIKLMKTGSLLKSMEILEKAKNMGLHVMIGCMIESSLANTAGALLSLWADYADLDGHLLIENDPFSGLKINDNGRVVLNERPGLGIQIKDSFF